MNFREGVVWKNSKSKIVEKINFVEFWFCTVIYVTANFAWWHLSHVYDTLFYLSLSVRGGGGGGGYMLN